MAVHHDWPDREDRSGVTATAPKHSLFRGQEVSGTSEYLAGWDIALLLFARNDSTRFISPTKTPEYLAAGKPVISTSIRDVVRPYGDLKLVEIADTPDEFINAAERILANADQTQWLAKVDAFLEHISWDKTWSQMYSLIANVIQKKRPARKASLPLSRVNQRTSAAATT